MSSDVSRHRPAGSSGWEYYWVFKKWVMRIEGIASCFLLIMLYATLIAQVFFRYVLSSPLGWTEEMSRFTFVWLVFIGSAYLASKNSHIVVTFIVDALGSATVTRWVVRIVAVVVTAAAGIVAWESVDFVQSTTSLLSPGVGISMSYVYAAPALGFLLVALHSIEFIITGKDPSSDVDVLEAVV